MKIKDLKRLKKLEIKFSEREKETNYLENKLEKCKESMQLIKSLNRQPVKITTLGNKKWRLLN